MKATEGWSSSVSWGFLPRPAYLAFKLDLLVVRVRHVPFRQAGLASVQVESVKSGLGERMLGREVSKSWAHCRPRRLRTRAEVAARRPGKEAGRTLENVLPVLYQDERQHPVFAVGRVAVMCWRAREESMWFPEVQERRSQVQCNSIIRGSASLPKSPATSPLWSARGGEGSAGSVFEAPDSGADGWVIGAWDALMHGVHFHSVYISDSI